MKSITQTFIVVPAFLLLLTSAHAAPPAPAPLPPAAQEALDKGIIAAKVPDYLLAIRYFEEAREKAPQAPIIYLNLGLAESKIPGRELRAIAWFGAYLAAYPQTPNAAAVKQEIEVLQVKNQSNLSHLFKSVQDAAGMIPSDSERNLKLADAAELWVRAGDISAALKVIAGLTWKPDFALRNFARIQAHSGNIAGARETAGAIADGEYKSEALIAIAAAQLAAGDTAAARSTLQTAQKSATLVASEQSRGFQLGEVAEAQAKAGDVAGALRSIALFSASQFLGIERTKDAALYSVARAQAASGNFADALVTAAATQASTKDMAYGDIGKAQAAADDIAGAQKTVDLMQTGLGKSQAQHPIGLAQVKAGDIPGALRTAEQIRDASYQRYVLDAILKAQIEARDFPAALKTADLIPEKQFIKHAQYDVFRAQLEGGDIAGAQRTTDHIQDAFIRVIAQTRMAREQVKGGDAASANRTLAAALGATELIRVEKEKASALGAIAAEQASLGDSPGAFKTVALIQDEKEKDSALGSIAFSQARLGDIPGTFKTFDLIQGEDQRNATRRHFINLQAHAGDVAGALRTADLFESPYWKGYGRLDVAEAQLRKGDIAGARNTLAEAQKAADLIQHSTPKHPKNKLLEAIAAVRVKVMPETQIAAAVLGWLKKLDDGDKSNPCPLNTPPFLDLAAHLKSQPPSNNPLIVFNSLHGTAEKMVKAQNVITGMLKQEVQR